MALKDNFIEDYRNRVFDKENRSYLMGIAILWIVLLHFYCWFQGKLPWWIYFFSDGGTGVDIFLFLSAYGLEASYRKNGWSIFYRNRAKRILPVYLVFLVFVFGLFMNEVPIDDILKQCAAQLTGISLFQEPKFFSTHFEFDWFTPALIIYYLLYPAISFILNFLAKRNIGAEILLLFFLFIISLLALRSIQLPIKLFLYRLPVFTLGAITYIHMKDKQTNRLLILYTITIIGGLLSNQHWFLTSSIVPSLLLVYSMVEGRRPFKKTISLIGRHSYEVYLAHIFPVTNFFMIYVFDNIYLYIAVTILWTIVVATVFSVSQKYINLAINYRKLTP